MTDGDDLIADGVPPPPGEGAGADLTDGLPGNEIDDRAATPSDGTGISGNIQNPNDPA
jgi:hypothetical protein